MSIPVSRRTAPSATWQGARSPLRPAQQVDRDAAGLVPPQDVLGRLGVQAAVHRPARQAQGHRGEPMAADVAALPDPRALLGRGRLQQAREQGPAVDGAAPVAPAVGAHQQQRLVGDGAEGRQRAGRDRGHVPCRERREVGQQPVAQQHPAGGRSRDPDVAARCLPARSGRSGWRASSTDTPAALAVRRCLPDGCGQPAVGDRVAAPRSGALDDDPGAGEGRRARQRLGGGPGLDGADAHRAPPIPAMGAGAGLPGAVAARVDLRQRHRDAGGGGRSSRAVADPGDQEACPRPSGTCGSARRRCRAPCRGTRRAGSP